ncbi:regulatory protein suaprga1 [Mycena crocata]|nr:regulatory protein suaprga1 [Mycena crocata]
MSAARTLRQLTTVSSRISSRQLCSASLSRLPLLPRNASRVPAATRAFSASARSMKAGSSDVALSQKLSEELQYEAEAQESAETPEFLASFQAQGTWKIQDTPGNNEVTLTRQFGNEHIRILFSVADLQHQDPDEFADEEDPEAEDHEPTGSSPTMRASSAPGAIDIEASVQNEQFLIENISYYADGKLVSDATIEGDWKRRGLYFGPEFSTLDVTLQENFEKFLEERDIDASVASFLTEYTSHKEQKEYVQWLENVKKFIDA